MTALERACQISHIKRFFGDDASSSGAAQEIAEAMEAHAAEVLWERMQTHEPMQPKQAGTATKDHGV